MTPRRRFTGIFSPESTFREKLEAVLLDAPRYLFHTRLTGKWLLAGNRHDKRRLAPGGRGVLLSKSRGDNLHACRVIPPLGAELMRAAFRDRPIRFSDTPRKTGSPHISFVIPFRGIDRMPGLMRTIQSLFAQKGACAEVIVVEQDITRGFGTPPPGVRYRFLQNSAESTIFRRSRAFNVGAAAAGSPVVVCHDADIPVPACYAAALFQRFREGWEAVQIQRFLFYLSESDTRRFLQSGRVLDGFVPVNVRQGWRGGTIAFTKAAFERIGGFDEAFIGWGGEDDEIYDRCRALRYYGFGFLPFIHLWHPPQPTKRPGAWDRNRALLRKRLAVSPEKRMEERRREAARRRDDEC